MWLLFWFYLSYTNDIFIRFYLLNLLLPHSFLVYVYLSYLPILIYLSVPFFNPLPFYLFISMCWYCYLSLTICDSLLTRAIHLFYFPLDCLSLYSYLLLPQGFSFLILTNIPFYFSPYLLILLLPLPFPSVSTYFILSLFIYGFFFLC